MLARRALLSFAVLQAAAAPISSVLAHPLLLPGQLDAPQADAQLCLDGGGQFACPPFRARLLAVLPMWFSTVMAVGFGCDCAPSLQDLVAFVGPDGTLLALERLDWNGKSISFATRLAMMVDREHLSLTRQVITTGPERMRESWTDYLRLTPAGLVDAPARPLTEGTLQMALATQRAEVAAMLKHGLHNVPPELLTALRTPPFGVGS